LKGFLDIELPTHVNKENLLRVFPNDLAKQSVDEVLYLRCFEGLQLHGRLVARNTFYDEGEGGDFESGQVDDVDYGVVFERDLVLGVDGVASVVKMDVLYWHVVVD
jgi:hypothetical protein